MGPGLSEWDSGIYKSFKFSESKSLELRGEFINFTNMPIFQTPSLSVTSSSFGEILTSQGERNVQLALKFLW